MLSKHLPEQKSRALTGTIFGGAASFPLRLPLAVEAAAITIHAGREGATVVVKIDANKEPGLAEALTAPGANVRDKYGNRAAVNRFKDVVTLQSVFADVVELKMRGNAPFTYGDVVRRHLIVWRESIVVEGL